MKRLLVILFFSIVAISAKAQELDGYNCIFIGSKAHNPVDVESIIEKTLTDYGFKIVRDYDDIPAKREERMATLKLTYNYEINYGNPSVFRIQLVNMLNETVFETEGFANTFAIGPGGKRDLRVSCNKALKKITKCKYSFDPSKTPLIPSPGSIYANYSEEQLKELLCNGCEHNPIEGIYKNIGDTYYKLAIIKENDNYNAIILETDAETMFKGEVKAVFKYLRSNYYNVAYYGINYEKSESIAEYDNENLILKFDNYTFIKIFPN
ncbi:MAG: hypothetical protein KBT27_12200 [Prevotellaceae bacterium]|nr:hypothetical protein [Candidatus Faecinaster equi]